MPKWVKGQSGCPRGRTPTAFVKTAEIRKRVTAAATDIVDALITAARAGDVNAGRTLLAVVCPPLRPMEQPVLMPMPADASLREQARACMAAMGNGQLAPGPAAMLIASLSNLARLIELDDLEVRIAALEMREFGPDEKPQSTYTVTYASDLPERAQ